MSKNLAIPYTFVYNESTTLQNNLLFRFLKGMVQFLMGLIILGVFFFIILDNIEYFSLFQLNLLFVFLILIIIYLFRKRPLKKIRFLILLHFTHSTRFHPFILFMIKYHSEKNIKVILKNRILHEVFRLDWDDIKLLIPLMVSNPELQRILTPHALNLMKNAISNKYQHTLIKSIIDYYELPINQIILEFIKQKPLDALQIERIAYEITDDHRKYLENHLPKNHPIFKKIDSLNTISLDDGFSIIL